MKSTKKCVAYRETYFSLKILTNRLNIGLPQRTWVEKTVNIVKTHWLSREKKFRAQWSVKRLMLTNVNGYAKRTSTCVNVCLAIIMWYFSKIRQTGHMTYLAQRKKKRNKNFISWWSDFAWCLKRVYEILGMIKWMTVPNLRKVWFHFFPKLCFMMKCLGKILCHCLKKRKLSRKRWRWARQANNYSQTIAA